MPKWGNLGRPKITKKKKVLLGNTKSTLVSRAVGTIETKALLLIILRTAWLVVATPVCMDHAGTVLL